MVSFNIIQPSADMFNRYLIIDYTSTTMNLFVDAFLTILTRN